ncbi:YihY/virulence factor BrkB family protein [Halomarina halobia]|uniref:YihY/virulence factor BrkB family protein n=1 Tax=Halomarina halobia TaxID=3033386 RepID=A0ABD6A8U9_9EURY|nr:YhjD/YihY/BrkB family envelope integrity protein [Halomarina sp. PSR21]
MAERLRATVASERIREEGVRILGLAREKQVTTVAASLGYHAFNTLVPLALFVVIGLSLFGGTDLAARAAESVTGVSSTQFESAGRSITRTQTGRLRAAALAFLILVWSAVRTFQATNGAFVSIYGTRGELGWTERAVDVALAAVTIPLALVLVGVVGVALTFAVDGPLWAVVSPLVLFAALVAAFLPMYYLFPAADVTVREVLPGAVFAAGLWTLSGVFFRLYATYSQSVHFYGVAGGLLLLLTWLYLGGLVILVGAVLNAVLAGRVEPDDEWALD